MSKVPVSCFIISKNEGDRIARTIRSVSAWADEVVVIDSESSDDTVSVALAEGCRVITQPWLGFGPQKRFGEDQCRNDWVLNIDADEVITPQLAREIIATFEKGDPKFVAYGMPIHMVYPGAAVPRPLARDNWYVRLYNRRFIRFRNSNVHDAVVTDGFKVGAFHAPIHHYSMRSFADMKRKLDQRMWLMVENAGSMSKWMLAPRLLIELPVNFFKYYVVRRHWTGGLVGLRYASIQARFRFLKIYRIWRSGKTRSAPRNAAA